MADTVVKAADSTIFNSRGLWGPYWVSPLIGAIIYVDASLDIAASKTTDGGATWGAAVVLTLNCDQMAAWFDQQTVGDTGDKIHIAAVDGAADLFYYANYDISANAWSSAVTSAQTGASTTDNANKVFITKTRSGNIVCGAVASGVTSQAVKLASPWSSMSAIANPFESNVNDAVLGVYCNTGDNDDAAILYWDTSANQFGIKVYDNSVNTWTESTSIAVVALNTTHHGWGASTRLSDGHVLLAILSEHATGTGDLLTFDLNINSVAAPGMAGLSNVFSNTIAAEPRVFIDQSNDDVYVSYINGTTFTATVHIKYHKSVDDMASFGAAVTIDEDAEDDHRLIGPTAMGPAAQGGRVQFMWFNDDLNNIYSNLNTDIEIAAAGPSFSNYEILGRPYGHSGERNMHQLLAT